jgi:hypothetical protein
MKDGGAGRHADLEIRECAAISKAKDREGFRRQEIKGDACFRGLRYHDVCAANELAAIEALY